MTKKQIKMIRKALEARLGTTAFEIREVTTCCNGFSVWIVREGERYLEEFNVTTEGNVYRRP